MTAIDALREKIKHRYVYDYNKRGIGTARCADDCPFDIEERKEFMGHEDIRTTEKYYGRVTIEDVAAKVREMTV